MCEQFAQRCNKTRVEHHLAQLFVRNIANDRLTYKSSSKGGKVCVEKINIMCLKSIYGQLHVSLMVGHSLTLSFHYTFFPRVIVFISPDLLAGPKSRQGAIEHDQSIINNI